MATSSLHGLRSRNVCYEKRLLFAHITWWRNQRKLVSIIYTAENICFRFRFRHAFEFFAKRPKSFQKTCSLFYNSAVVRWWRFSCVLLSINPPGAEVRFRSIYAFKFFLKLPKSFEKTWGLGFFFFNSAGVRWWRFSCVLLSINPPET